ncbi:MAG: Fic family protein [Micrococcales bacterium]|nr:Fic family protein [Micrococcales bacterium]
MQSGLPVPAVGKQEHIWVAESDGRSGRARRADASGPYQSAVPASITTYSPTLPAGLAADLDEASSWLAEFDAHMAATWGAEHDVFVPMTAVLLRTESASSSQIEQLTVGARQLALAEIGQSSSANAVVVVGNVAAMERALSLTGGVSQEAILSIHDVLLSRQAGWERHAGHYRDQLVWVGTSGLGPRGAAHVAPQPELIPGAMADLVDFMARVDLPIVLQLAVAHAQFETIHPFVDGNGRVGRALLHSMLREAGVVTHTTAPVSAGLLVDTEGYFDALTAYRAGDAEPIVRQMADACRFAASSGRRLSDDLAAQLSQSREKLAGLRPQATAWQVLSMLVAHPVVNASIVSAKLGLSDVTALRALAQLADAGVLEERTGLRRNRVWQHGGILAVLDAYAQGLRRR